jgi:hypothetical protein
MDRVADDFKAYRKLDEECEPLDRKHRERYASCFVPRNSPGY